MTVLAGTVLLASLLGSLHCAGMCGAFVALCMTDAGERRAGAIATQSAYHGGRLLTYAMLGAFVGGLGATLDLSGSVLFGLQRAALVVAGAALVVFGTISLLRLLGARIPRLAPPRPIAAVAARGHRWALTLPPVHRALAIGLMSTLLPCGWLYAFAVTAAGTGSVAMGALVMAVFWAGTVPALAGVGTAVRGMAGPLRRHVPVAASLALIIVGLFAITGRFDVPALAVDPGANADLEVLAARVGDLDTSDLPCHTDDP